MTAYYDVIRALVSGEAAKALTADPEWVTEALAAVDAQEARQAPAVPTYQYPPTGTAAGQYGGGG